MHELVEPVSENDHILGRSDAPVTLVEYGDFECPFCGRAYGEVKAVLRMLGDDVLFVFRHFPLTEMHPHALLAAQAAEAAGAQGRFWPMYALLFENQNALEPDDLLRYAEMLGLDVDRFADDLRTGIHLPKVEHDIRTGLESGVRGTPTFFVDGHRLEGGWDADSLATTIREALRRVAAGVHPRV